MQITMSCSPNPTIVKDTEESKPVGAENTDAASAVKITLDNACPAKDVAQKKQPTNNPASLVVIHHVYSAYILQ